MLEISLRIKLRRIKWIHKFLCGCPTNRRQHSTFMPKAPLPNSINHARKNTQLNQMKTIRNPKILFPIFPPIFIVRACRRRQRQQRFFRFYSFHSHFSLILFTISRFKTYKITRNWFNTIPRSFLDIYAFVFAPI